MFFEVWSGFGFWPDPDLGRKCISPTVSFTSYIRSFSSTILFRIFLPYPDLGTKCISLIVSLTSNIL